jgi:hypothetical protein
MQSLHRLTRREADMSTLQHQDTFQPYYAGREKDGATDRTVHRWKPKKPESDTQKDVLIEKIRRPVEAKQNS